MINQDIIAQDLFYKIRSRFPKMEMGDGNGQPTFEATKGRFFDFDAIFEGVNLGTVSISINEPGSLKIYFNRNILEDVDPLVSKTWYNFLKEMRKFAMKRLMSFDTRDITKTNLDKRDYGYLAQKESVMNESMMRGTSRTSYKPLEKTRLIIRHSKPVDESIPGARSRNIDAIFIENSIGERYKYPFNHKAGAEAMQRHVANGGLPHDPIGKKIIEMSEDIAKLKAFRHYVQKEDLMNSQTNHIVERANAKLESLKETMAKLSRQHHYEDFKMNFGQGVTDNGDQQLMDQLTLEDYKEKFTVKSFKEDIADVFPLIHRIMQENSEIDLDEVAGDIDTTPEISLEDLVAESPEHEFDTWTTTLIETTLTPEEIENLQGLLSEHFPVGINGSGATGALEELGINLSNQVKETLAQIAKTEGPDADAKPVVLEYLSQFEPEVYGALGLDMPVQEQAVEEGHGGVMVNGKAVDVSSLEVDGIDTRDYPDFSDAYFSGGSFEDGTELSDSDLEELSSEHGDLLHELVFDRLHEAQQAGVSENMDQTPEEKRHAMEYLQKVARAIKTGEVQPEEIEQEFFNTLPMLGVSDEKTFAAWDRITNHSGTPKEKPSMSDAEIDAQMKGIEGDEEDDAQFIANLRNQAKKGGISQDTTGFGAGLDEEEMDRENKDKVVEKKGSKMKEIAEFIMGFYDRNTGNFPLGETGVAIKVQKEFGEKAGELAERLIQKMAAQGSANNELSDIKRLSGMQGGVEEELDPNYKSPEFDEFAKTFKGTEGGMKPIDMYGGAQAARNDEKGQQYYKDRSSGGFTNAVKDLLGKPKADPKYGPKEIPKKINEGTEFIDLQKLAGIGSEQKKTTKSSEMFDLKKLAGI